MKVGTACFECERTKKKRDGFKSSHGIQPTQKRTSDTASKQSDQERITDESHYRGVYQIFYHIMLHSTLHYSSPLLRYYNYTAIYTIAPLEATLGLF